MASSARARDQDIVPDEAWVDLGEPITARPSSHGRERVIAVRPSLVRALRGNGNTAIVLSQLLFWSRRLSHHEGWFFQTQRQLEEQTGLGADALRKATRLLVRLGVVEIHRRGAPARLYYRVHLPRLAALLPHDQAASVADHGPYLVSDHGRQLDPDHGLLLAAGDGLSLAAGHGPPHKENIEESKEEMVSSSTPITDGPLAPGATHSNSESPIDSSPAIASMPIPGLASGGHSTSATRAKQPEAAASAPGDLMLTEEPPRQPTRPRGTTSRRCPATPISQDFVVTAAMRTWASERVPAINLARETEKFKNHAKANDRRQVDWQAAWRNWMLKAQEFAERSQRPAARGSVVV